MRKNIFAAALLLLSASGQAQGLVANDRQLRDDLAWLVDHNLITLNLTTWPLSQSEIERAMATIRRTQDPVYLNVVQRVTRRLSELKAPVRIGAYASTGQDRLPPGMAQPHTAQQSMSVAGNSQGDFWDVNLQGNVEGDQFIRDSSHVNPNGSYAAVKFYNQWLSFGEMPQWWGPGTESSLIRSDAARPVVGVQMQRDEQTPFESAWLSWLGPWQYQLSAGELRQYERPAKPYLFGGRVTIQPSRSLTLGASRVIMWGGKGRPNDFDSFRDAMIGRDNTGSQDRDPGDELAGMDFRLSLGSMLNLPTSLYGQVVGEDMAGFTPSHNTFLGGIEGHTDWGDSTLNLSFEASDTRSGISQTGIVYYHYCYQQGYYQQGWALGDAMGGDGTRFTARSELVLDDGQRFAIRGVWARVNRLSQSINGAYPQADLIRGIEASWRLPLGDNLNLQSGIWHSMSERENDDNGAFIQVEIPLFF